MSNIISFPKINEGVKAPLRWYRNPKRRNSNRRACKLDGGCNYKLWTNPNELNPFQIYTQLTPPFTFTWVIKDADGNVVFTPNVALLNQDFVEDFIYIYYKSDFFNFVMPQGYYTSEITIDNGVDDPEVWYSEEFYSIGYCSQGEQQMSNPELCQSQWTVDSGSVEFDATGSCQFCNGRDNLDPVILTLANILPDLAGFYFIKIKINSLENCTLTIDVGEGDTFTITQNGTYTFYATSALSTDLTLTFAPIVDSVFFNWCMDYLGVETLESQWLYDCHIALAWWNDCGLVGELFYGNSSYANVFFLEEEAGIVNPDQKIYIETTENGEKDLTPTFQKRTTIYTIELGAQPYYVIEALFEMVLHKFIKIILPGDQGGGEQLIKNVTIKQGDGDELGGCLRLVTMTYELDDTTVVDQCCDEITNIPCVGSPLPGSIAQQNIICKGNQASFIASLLTTGPDIIYQWQSSKDGPLSGFADVIDGSGANTDTYTTAAIEDQTWFRICSTCLGSGLTTCSDAIEIEFYDTELAASSNSPICDGSDLTLFSTGGLTNYNWTGPNSFTSTLQNPVIPGAGASEAGDYTVTAEDIHGCVLESSTTVVVNDAPVISLDSQSDETAPGACDGEAHVSATGGTGPYTFQVVETAESNGTGDFVDLCAGTFHIQIIDDNGCIDEVTVIIR